jgi:hypothetical protein
MKRLMVCVLVLGGGCAEARLGDATSSASSVRERLERAPVVLTVASATSAGGMTAQHRIPGGWDAGFVDLAIDGGSLELGLYDGTLSLNDVRLELAPIEIPESLLGHPVRLTDIRLDLASSAITVPRWISPDEGRAELELELDLEWSLENRGTTSPLGAPALPRIPVELVLTGSGANVTAELRARVPGEVWSWADLIKFEDLTLILDARTER